MKIRTILSHLVIVLSLLFYLFCSGLVQPHDELFRQCDFRKAPVGALCKRHCAGGADAPGRGTEACAAFRCSASYKVPETLIMA